MGGGSDRSLVLETEQGKKSIERERDGGFGPRILEGKEFALFRSKASSLDVFASCFLYIN